MGDVVRLNITTTVPHQPDDILEAAKGCDFETVVVIGMRGAQAEIRASTSDVERVAFLMQLAQHYFMNKVVPGGFSR